jgi:Protein of unknown function DUF2834
MDTRMQRVLLGVVVMGAILPLCFLVPFFVSSGFDPLLFFKQLIQTPVSRSFAMDVMASALTLFLFVFYEGRRLKMTNLWAYVVCTLLVGVSLGLPLFLFFRERRLNKA